MTSREGFRMTMDISAYSLIALARGAVPMMEARGGGSILTLSYLGSQRVFPGYNVMGVAKAALEATVRYLAADIGPKNIRVNAVSAGPIKTLAAAGIKGFSNILHIYPDRAPLRRNVETSEVAEAAAFLLSEAGKGDHRRSAARRCRISRDRHVVAGFRRTLTDGSTAGSTVGATADGCCGRCRRLRLALAHDLVAIHAAVGLGEQRLVAVAVVREHGGAGADRERHSRCPAAPRTPICSIASCSSWRLFSASSRPQPASTTMNSSPA